MWLMRLGWLLLVSPIVIIPGMWKLWPDLWYLAVPVALLAMVCGLVVTHYASRWRLRRKARKERARRPGP